MGFINKIIQFVLVVATLLLINIFTFVGIFSSNQNLTKILEASGFYSVASKSMSSELIGQITTTNQDLSVAIKNSLGLVINSDIAKTVITPGQIVFVEWLNNGQPTINLDLDLLPIKNKLIASSVDPRVRFEITKLLPDTLLILSSKKDDNNILPQLERVKLAYTTAKNALPVLWLIVASCVLFLFMLNIKKGSKKFTKPCYPLLLSGVLGLIIATSAVVVASSITLDSSAKLEPNNFQLLTKIMMVALQQTTLAFSLLAVVSLAAIVVSRFVFRRRDKALKHKGKH